MVILFVCPLLSFSLSISTGSSRVKNIFKCSTLHLVSLGSSMQIRYTRDISSLWHKFAEQFYPFLQYGMTKTYYAGRLLNYELILHLICDNYCTGRPWYMIEYSSA